MKINSELLNELFDSNIRIENVFYMQLVTACDSMPDSFWEVLDDDPSEILDTLGLGGKDTSEYSDLNSKSETLEFLHDNRVSGVLLQFSTPVPKNFRLGEGGEFKSCSISWGMTTWNFVHADTIEEALTKAVEMKEQYFEKCLNEARKQAA
jgi:hypothetical protein